MEYNKLYNMDCMSYFSIIDGGAIRFNTNGYSL